MLKGKDIGGGINKGGGPRIISSSQTRFSDAEIKMTKPDRKLVGENFKVAGSATAKMITTTFTTGKGSHNDKKTTTRESFVTNTNTGVDEEVVVRLRIGNKKVNPKLSVRGNSVHWSHKVKNVKGDSVEVTAILDAKVRESSSDEGGGGSHQHSEIKKVKRETSMKVNIDREGPEVKEATVENVSIGPPYEAVISGKVHDPSGVRSVSWNLDSNSGKAVFKSGNRDRWEARVPIPNRTKAHTIRISAKDDHGNTRTNAAKVTVPEDKEPPVLKRDFPDRNPHEPFFVEGGITVPVMGTAQPVNSKIKTVKWRKDDGPVQEAENIKGDWSEWRIMAEFKEAVSHEIAIWIKDKAGNGGSKDEPDEILEVNIKVPG